MKKILLGIFSLFISLAVHAQSFVTESGADDTVRNSYSSGSEIKVYNRIGSASSTPVTLKWRVISSNFMTGWDPATSGICDNSLCRFDVNALQSSSSSETSDPYSASKGDFHVLFAVNNPANGTSARVTVHLTDEATAYSRTLTFIAYKSALGITTTVIGDDNVKLFPNPARDFINVLYDSKANVKTAAIYNLIGKTIQVYKVSDNNSAKLDLENVPSGVYFLRLMNANGQVVATRRFTRQ
jgi:hypothetical protein